MLDNYKGASGKRYKSDYRAILNWVPERVLSEKKVIPMANAAAYKSLQNKCSLCNDTGWIVDDEGYSYKVTAAAPVQGVKYYGMIGLFPRNIDAEQSILSTILVEQEAIGDVAGLLEPGDFYHPRHQLIFAAALNM